MCVIKRKTHPTESSQVREREWEVGVKALLESAITTPTIEKRGERFHRMAQPALGPSSSTAFVAQPVYGYSSGFWLLI